MVKRIFFILVLLLIFPVGRVGAYGSIKGTSLGEFGSCDYYLVEDSYGDYTLVEWYGGITPYSGDTLVGELHSYGFKDLYDINRDSSTHVWIDDYMLSEDSAAEKLIDECGYDRSISDYFDVGYYSYYSSPSSSYSTYATPTSSCPTNSHASGGQCSCNDNYVINDTEDACVPVNSYCQLHYGYNSYGTGKSCYCSSGYHWNETQTGCAYDEKAPEAPKPTYTYPTPQVQVPIVQVAPVTAEATPVVQKSFTLDITKVNPYEIGKAKPAVLKVAAAFRDCPSTQCKVIRYYSEDAQVNVVGEYNNKEWYNVQAKDDKRNILDGWMHNSVLTLPEISKEKDSESTSTNQNTPSVFKRLWNFLFK